MLGRNKHLQNAIRVAMRPFSSQYIPRGLVKAYDDSNDKYSSSMDLAASYKLVSTRAAFRDAMLNDSMNVKNVKIDLGNIANFMSSDEICGHSETIKTLEDVYQCKNNLVIVSGGYSVGKSKIVNHFSKKKTLLHSAANDVSCDLDTNKMQISVVVDGRLAGNKSLDEAIVEQLNKYPENLVTVPIVERIHKSAGLVNVSDDAVCTDELTSPAAAKSPLVVTIGRSLTAATNPLQKTGDTTTSALSVLLDAATSSETAPLKLLVIDEANRFFTPLEAKKFLETGKSSPEWEAKHKQILETLKVLLAFTKQRGIMSVLLVSSDYSFPFKLRQLGFDSKFINFQMVVREPSPAAAVNTVKSWGVGDNLARALVDVFGGHLARIKDELLFMNGRQDPGYWESEVQFGMLDTAKLMGCLKEAGYRDPQLAALVKLTLRTLALKGFVPTGGCMQAVSCDLSLLSKAKKGLQSLVDRTMHLVMMEGSEKREARLEKQMVELLTRCNIAGYVEKGAKVEDLTENRPDGLVPATQWVRMLLVREFGPQWLAEDEARRR